MNKTIARQEDCELRIVIHFLNARNVKLAEIHHQISKVHGENVRSDDKWLDNLTKGAI